MDRLAAMAEAASHTTLTMLVETHRRTATEVPEVAAELAFAGYGLTLDHSHYVSKGVSIERMEVLRRHARLLQVRGCDDAHVEAAVETQQERHAARQWLDWLLSGTPTTTPLVVEYIDRQRDWWPSINALLELARLRG
jgi:hypothetical protein